MSRSKFAPDIIRMHGEGMSGAAIALQLGCTPACVSQVRRRAGLAARKPAPVKPPKVERPKAAEVEPTPDHSREQYDGHRADRLLRRFSFQDLPADFVRSARGA